MINKKAGIITFHDSRNYGAVLQAFALQQKISEQCREVEIIHYQNPEIAQVLKLWNYTGGGVKGVLKAAFGMVFRWRKKMAFDSYLKQNLHLSESVNENTIKAYSSRYDILITGSDQVWNTELTAKDMQYFLTFSEENQLRIAYAASFGDKKIVLTDAVKNALSAFDCITLREAIMLEEVERYAKQKPFICCDPTLLLTSEQWAEHSAKPLSKEKYIFLFMIDDSQELRSYAEKLAQRKGLKLISNKNDLSFFCHPKPDDFLSWIRHAEYVVTNSFHGTVFCIHFQKQFVSHLRNASGQKKRRIAVLLDNFGLSHRTTDFPTLDIDCAEDWQSIELKKKEMRESSWNGIVQFLNSHCA